MVALYVAVPTWADVDALEPLKEELMTHGNTTSRQRSCMQSHRRGVHGSGRAWPAEHKTPPSGWREQVQPPRRGGRRGPRQDVRASAKQTGSQAGASVPE